MSRALIGIASLRLRAARSFRTQAPRARNGAIAMFQFFFFEKATNCAPIKNEVVRRKIGVCVFAGSREESAFLSFFLKAAPQFCAW